MFHYGSLWLFQNMTIRKRRHYVLLFLLCWFKLHLFIDEWLNQEHCVSNSLRFIWFVLWFTIAEIRHHLLSKLLSWLWVHMVIEKWSKQTHCVRYFHYTIFFCMIWHLKTRQYVLAHLLCWSIINLVFESDLSRHIVLPISLIFIWYV